MGGEGSWKAVPGFYMEDGLEGIELELGVRGASWGGRGAFASGEEGGGGVGARDQCPGASENLLLGLLGHRW